MPWNPSEQFDHRQIFAGIAGAGNSIGADIAEEKKKRKVLEEQNAFNQMAFKTVSQVLSEEEKQQFLSGNLNKQNGIITAAGARMMQKFEGQKQQEAARQKQMDRDLRLRIAGMRHAPKEDTWEHLNKQVKAASGADLGDWQSAKEKREENGYIIADITKPNPMAEQAAMLGLANVPPTIKKTMRLPKSTFNHFMGRFNALGGIDPNAQQEAAPAQPEQAPAASADKAASGYIPGRKYAGKTYKGGDPYDPANWQ